MKLSISIPDEEFDFLNKCVDDGDYESRSAVIARALRLLRSADLGKMYDEAFAEWQESADFADWDSLTTSKTQVYLDSALRLHLEI